MAELKKPEADLRRSYQRVFEICVIVALVFMILAFKFFPAMSGGEKIAQVSQELFNVEDVQQTKQENRPPPPPKPPIPIEAPSEDVLEDIDIASTELDVSAFVEAPPPKVEKVEAEPQYFVAVEEMPTPIGGLAGIQKRIQYSQIAIRAGIEGRIYVLAFVNTEGIVTKATITKGLGAGLDESALEAVKATRFNPGKQRGKPVNVQVSIPISFSLRN